MTKKRFYLFILAILCVQALSAEGIEIVDIKPTPLFPRQEAGEGLRQLVRLTLHNNAETSDCRIVVSVSGGDSYVQNLPEVKNGDGTYDVLIPDLKRPETITFTVMEGDKVLAVSSREFKPQKKWKVYYAAVSHQDLSFETYFQYIRRGVREEGLDLALQYCRETDDWDEDSRFRWNVETSEPVLRWANKRSIDEVRELVRRIREGRIELGAIHNTISSQMAGYEVLARTFYMPNRYVVDKLGIDPAKVAIINDVTGITRSWPLYSKEAGIPYLKHGSNTPNCLDDLKNLPVFDWASNDGDPSGKIMCQTGSYYSEDKLSEWNETEMEKLIERHETPEWAYDCILAYDSHDFAIPTLDNARNIREWNRKYAYPRVICSLISSYFDDVASQSEKAYVANVDKDASDCWDDQDAADAELLGLARRTTARLGSAEKLSTIAMATTTGGSPDKELYQAYHGLVSYHEHNNGVIHGGNHQFYETDKEMNRRLVREAAEFTDSILNKTLPRLNSLVRTKENSIIVYNSLNWERNDVVTINENDIPENMNEFSLIDASNGKEVPVQVLDNGKMIFFAEGIPGMGYKVYTIRASEKCHDRKSTLSTDTHAENRYFDIELDKTGNKISRIFDKELKCDILDEDSPYAMGEYIYYDHYRKQYLKTEFTDIRYYKGAVADEIHIYQKAYLAEDLKLTVLVYHDLKKIDFSLSLNKLSNEESLVGSWNRRFLEAMFCAIPVKVPDFVHHHELAGAVTQPGNPNLQLESAEAAYYAIQHFADASNEDMGVTLSTIDAALVEYGHPRPGFWNSGARKPMEPVVKPENSSMFLYLMNNFFCTNICVDQPGPKRFDFSLRSHSGNWKEGKAYKFAWETSHPLIASFAKPNRKGYLPSEHSFISVNCDNVICTSFKPAEPNGSGYIARFFELSGQESEVKVRFNFLKNIRDAFSTDLLEVNDGRIESSGNEISFGIRSHGISTVRIEGKDNDRSVSGFKAKAVSDSHVHLEWNSENDGLSHFAVYRSEDPECPAIPFNYIGYAGESYYDDKPCLNFAGWNSSCLEAERTYYYRIVPVDRFNMPGTASDAIPCKTLSKTEMDEAPSKVLGLHAVHVSPLAPENYVNLFFYTNIEPDIDRYEIHRGESDDFVPSSSTLLEELKPDEMTLNYKGSFKYSELECQMYSDMTAEVNKDYWYCVCAVDKSGNKGEYSDKVKIRMNYIPVEIKPMPYSFTDFSDATASVMVEISTQVKNCDLYYTTDNSEAGCGSQKYTGPFVLENDALVKVAAYDRTSGNLLFKKMSFIVCPRAVAQTSINDAWNAPMAFDNNKEIGSQWQCMQYGGGSKNAPQDTWLGYILPEKLKICGVEITGDDRDIMPVQENYRIYTRLDGKMSLAGELRTQGVNLGKKNHNRIIFDHEFEADGIMLSVLSDELPKSDLADQDGIVRVVEFKLILPDGSVKSLKELVEKDSVQKDGALLQAAQTAANL